MTPKRKTATIERYHLYGTPRYELRVTYRGCPPVVVARKEGC